MGQIEEIAPAIEAAKAAGAGALNVVATPLFFNNRSIIFERVEALRLPAIYQWPEMAEEGGLLAYGPRIVDIYRKQISRQMIQLLKGTKPADIPIRATGGLRVGHKYQDSEHCRSGDFARLSQSSRQGHRIVIAGLVASTWLTRVLTSYRFLSPPLRARETGGLSMSPVGWNCTVPRCRCPTRQRCAERAE